MRSRRRRQSELAQGCLNSPRWAGKNYQRQGETWSRKTAQPEASPYHSRKPMFRYWSVADGQHALMMQTCVRSARAAGVTEEFHVWSDRTIAGAMVKSDILAI